MLRIQQLNIHTAIRSTRAAAIAAKEAEFIRTHNPLPITSRLARFALAFIASVIGRAVVGDDPGAEGGETGDDDGDGLLDGAPGADPGGGGGAAPGGVEDEADYGEDGYDKGEGEDAGEGEFLFAWDAGFECEGDGDYGYCLRGSVSLGGEGERELGRRRGESSAKVKYRIANGALSCPILPVHTAYWLLSAVETDFYTARLAPQGSTIGEKSDCLLRMSVVQSAVNW